MMGPPKEGLTVAFQTVEELFAGPYLFNLPWYQRAYAWSEDLALRLLNDIINAHDERARRYFIGHVLLARQFGEERHVLVDGQQRAVTLMILFALLRHKLGTAEWDQRMSPLLDADAGVEGKEPRYRLAPQPTVEEFFRQQIQSPTAMTDDADEFGLSEVEGNILHNRIRLQERLNEYVDDKNDLASLTEFLLTRCLLVLEVIDGESENEAWKMLQTEENTGLPFHHSDRAKVTLIEAMKPEEREDAGKMWEKCQAKLGGDGMQQLIAHIRDLSSDQRSSQPVEKDIVTRYQLNRNGLDFMTRHLVPSARNLVALLHAEVGTPKDRPTISRYLRHLEWVGYIHWRPAGMCWLKSRDDSDPETAEFFRLLARKAWTLRISGADQVELERRFIALSKEIKSGVPINKMQELEVAPKWYHKTRENLLSRTFYDKRYSRIVLRYLSDLLGADSGVVEGDLVTIEHVLPRKPGKNSEWLQAFGDAKEISNYAHRIGNMALLSFKDNQRVGNREYADKRKVLERSGFILSVDAAEADQWAPDHVMARSERLVRHIFDHWQLKL